MRKLTDREKVLIRIMLRDVPRGAPIIERLDSDQVEEMNDGGMGPLRVVVDRNRQYGETFAQYEWRDDDGIAISFAIHLDDVGVFRTRFVQERFQPS